MSHYSQYRPLPLAQVPQWDFETDVAIIGFGATGACAAIEARAAGAQVLLFERSSGSGGASALSGGEIYVGGGTDAQIAAGFADTVEDFTRYLKMAGGPCADEAKCELYGREALAHYQWLKDQGVPYRGNFLPGKHIEPTDDSTLIWSGSEAAAPFCHEARPAPRGHTIRHMGWGGGRPLVDILERRARDLGAQVHVDARAVALITDGDSVAGVVVRIDNRDRFVRARKGVVLATGGFVFNEAMRRKYCPDSFRVNSPIGDKDDGVGIELGVSVGGDAIHMDQFFTTCPWTMPESHAHGVFVNAHAREGRDPLFDKQPPILKALDQSPFVALELDFQTSYFSFFTLGGLRTSTDAEVLDRSGSPIPGLFAAGRCTSGLPAWGHGYSSGLSLADCTFFGRQAGRRAAA